MIIEVIVATDGKVAIQTTGFAGSNCKAASEFLERALGVKQAETLTPEYYAQQTTQQQAREGQA